MPTGILAELTVVWDRTWMNSCQMEEKMDSSRSSIFVLFAVAGLVLLLVLPSLADADGGPILPDPEL